MLSSDNQALQWKRHFPSLFTPCTPVAETFLTTVMEMDTVGIILLYILCDNMIMLYIVMSFFLLYICKLETVFILK